MQDGAEGCPYRQVITFRPYHSTAGGMIVDGATLAELPSAACRLPSVRKGIVNVVNGVGRREPTNRS